MPKVKLLVLQLFVSSIASPSCAPKVKLFVLQLFVFSIASPSCAPKVKLFVLQLFVFCIASHGAFGVLRFRFVDRWSDLNLWLFAFYIDHSIGPWAPHHQSDLKLSKFILDFASILITPRLLYPLDIFRMALL